jgi:hypothetical protein
MIKQRNYKIIDMKQKKKVEKLNKRKICYKKMK